MVQLGSSEAIDALLCDLCEKASRGESLRTFHFLTRIPQLCDPFPPPLPRPPEGPLGHDSATLPGPLGHLFPTVGTPTRQAEGIDYAATFIPPRTLLLYDGG